MKKLICCLTMVAMLGGVSLSKAEGEKKKPDPEAQFKKMDTNGDSKLSETEFIGKRTGEKADAAKKAFARKDKDSDGSLTLEEFKATPKKKKNS